jgi:hypothetical protein
MLEMKKKKTAKDAGLKIQLQISMVRPKSLWQLQT